MNFKIVTKTLKRKNKRSPDQATNEQKTTRNSLLINNINFTPSYKNLKNNSYKKLDNNNHYNNNYNNNYNKNYYKNFNNKNKYFNSPNNSLKNFKYLDKNQCHNHININPSYRHNNNLDRSLGPNEHNYLSNPGSFNYDNNNHYNQHKNNINNHHRETKNNQQHNTLTHHCTNQPNLHTNLSHPHTHPNYHHTNPLLSPLHMDTPIWDGVSIWVPNTHLKAQNLSRSSSRRSSSIQNKSPCINRKSYPHNEVNRHSADLTLATTPSTPSINTDKWSQGFNSLQRNTQLLTQISPPKNKKPDGFLAIDDLRFDKTLNKMQASHGKLDRNIRNDIEFMERNNKKKNKNDTDNNKSNKKNDKTDSMIKNGATKMLKISLEKLKTDEADGHILMLDSDDDEEEEDEDEKEEEEDEKEDENEKESNKMDDDDDVKIDNNKLEKQFFFKETNGNKFDINNSNNKNAKNNHNNNKHNIISGYYLSMVDQHNKKEKSKKPMNKKTKNQKNNNKISKESSLFEDGLEEALEKECDDDKNSDDEMHGLMDTLSRLAGYRGLQLSMTNKTDEGLGGGGVKGGGGGSGPCAGSRGGSGACGNDKTKKLKNKSGIEEKIKIFEKFNMTNQNTVSKSIVNYKSNKNIANPNSNTTNKTNNNNNKITNNQISEKNINNNKINFYNENNMNPKNIKNNCHKNSVKTDTRQLKTAPLAYIDDDFTDVRSGHENSAEANSGHGHSSRGRYSTSTETGDNKSFRDNITSDNSDSYKGSKVYNVESGGRNVRTPNQEKKDSLVCYLHNPLSRTTSPGVDVRNKDKVSSGEGEKILKAQDNDIMERPRKLNEINTKSKFFVEPPTRSKNNKDSGRFTTIDNDVVSRTFDEGTFAGGYMAVIENCRRTRELSRKSRIEFKGGLSDVGSSQDKPRKYIKNDITNDFFINKEYYSAATNVSISKSCTSGNMENKEINIINNNLDTKKSINSSNNNINNNKNNKNNNNSKIYINKIMNKNNAENNMNNSSNNVNSSGSGRSYNKLTAEKFDEISEWAAQAVEVIKNHKNMKKNKIDSISTSTSLSTNFENISKKKSDIYRLKNSSKNEAQYSFSDISNKSTEDSRWKEICSLEGLFNNLLSRLHFPNQFLTDGSNDTCSSFIEGNMTSSNGQVGATMSDDEFICKKINYFHPSTHSLPTQSPIHSSIQPHSHSSISSPLNPSSYNQPCPSTIYPQQLTSCNIPLPFYEYLSSSSSLMSLNRIQKKDYGEDEIGEKAKGSLNIGRTSIAGILKEVEILKRKVLQRVAEEKELQALKCWKLQQQNNTLKRFIAELLGDDDIFKKKKIKSLKKMVMTCEKEAGASLEKRKNNKKTDKIKTESSMEGDESRTRTRVDGDGKMETSIDVSDDSSNQEFLDPQSLFKLPFKHRTEKFNHSLNKMYSNNQEEEEEEEKETDINVLILKDGINIEGIHANVPSDCKQPINVLQSDLLNTYEMTKLCLSEVDSITSWSVSNPAVNLIN